jgi:peptidoglycan DL-endopeptidase CwlO
MLLTLRSIWLGAGALMAGTLTVARLVDPTSAPAPAPRPVPPAVVATPRVAPRPAVADSVVALGMRLLGTDYCYAGVTPQNGFDCSGFVMYCFSRFGIDVPHSSELQAKAGEPVPRAQARPGDIVIFTGTDPTRRSPGHAGIVVSQPGEPIRFVHSSSARKERGVKVSQVDSTGYENRFLGIRRVIK